MSYTIKVGKIEIKTDSAEEATHLAKKLNYGHISVAENVSVKPTSTNKNKSRRPRWTDEEVVTLAKNIDKPLRELVVLLPYRQSKAINSFRYRIKTDNVTNRVAEVIKKATNNTSHWPLR